jgi:hypothetical protein
MGSTMMIETMIGYLLNNLLIIHVLLRFSVKDECLLDN